MMVYSYRILIFGPCDAAFYIHRSILVGYNYFSEWFIFSFIIKSNFSIRNCFSINGKNVNVKIRLKVIGLVSIKAVPYKRMAKNSSSVKSLWNTVTQINVVRKIFQRIWQSEEEIDTVKILTWYLLIIVCIIT